MSSLSFTRLLALFSVLVYLVGGATASPTIDTRVAKPKSNAYIASAPHFVIYNDKWVGFPSTTDLAGYNVLYVLPFINTHLMLIISSTQRDLFLVVVWCRGSSSRLGRDDSCTTLGDQDRL